MLLFNGDCLTLLYLNRINLRSEGTTAIFIDFVTCKVDKMWRE